MCCDKKYYLGLDIGTDSAGYAVTDVEYSLLKYRGEPMWGTTLVESANDCADRRMHRTSRRRIDRRQQRAYHCWQSYLLKKLRKMIRDFL